MAVKTLFGWAFDRIRWDTLPLQQQKNTQQKGQHAIALCSVHEILKHLFLSPK